MYVRCIRKDMSPRRYATPIGTLHTRGRETEAEIEGEAARRGDGETPAPHPRSRKLWAAQRVRRPGDPHAIGTATTTILSAVEYQLVHVWSVSRSDGVSSVQRPSFQGTRRTIVTR